MLQIKLITSNFIANLLYKIFNQIRSRDSMYIICVMHSNAVKIGFHVLDAKLPTQLKLLINVVPPKGQMSKKGKYSTQEYLKNIMIIVEKPGDLNSVISNQIKTAAK